MSLVGEPPTVLPAGSHPRLKPARNHHRGGVAKAELISVHPRPKRARLSVVTRACELKLLSLPLSYIPFIYPLWLWRAIGGFSGF